MSRSKVFILRSMGMETGSMEEAEKRTVMARRPGMRAPSCAISEDPPVKGALPPPIVPTANARNMKRGKRIPETMIFGRR